MELLTFIVTIVAILAFALVAFALPETLRPENRVHARSNPPHQKCVGLHFPAKLPRNRFSDRSACVSA